MPIQHKDMNFEKLRLGLKHVKQVKFMYTRADGGTSYIHGFVLSLSDKEVTIADALKDGMRHCKFSGIHSVEFAYPGLENK